MRTLSMEAKEGQRTQNLETISANSEFIELLSESEKSSETLKDLENFQQSCSNSTEFSSLLAVPKGFLLKHQRLNPMKDSFMQSFSKKGPKEEDTSYVMRIERFGTIFRTLSWSPLTCQFSTRRPENPRNLFNILYFDTSFSERWEFQNTLHILMELFRITRGSSNTKEKSFAAFPELP
ncbi:hypothetical protein AVEN_206729-1 [Araneus ventricosus]|uniref:Uncharacterized protein n=1 Tax=Araneus ventricosus TaxID=182803 RepID=A0A4Y2JX79_ARAVE|nr:hypothetical protein AVEN_196153-1 [Araneus ventricosus]GBM94325.1 hypothetical protein AVEN_27157-1 [Araneus ventricosus]GBM94345.1 hypothetical protein AVEN_136319-1 [Araneus ventricosus]GBM94365.1 hypothetical protein AVEN_206729-1 [Araneus ventricosus]